MKTLEREVRAVFADYGHDIYNEDLIQVDWYPSVGRVYMVRDPVLLFNIAHGLACISPIRTVDVFGKPCAIGFRTDNIVILTKLSELRDWFHRYRGLDKSAIPELIEQANLMASMEFRHEFLANPIAMKRKHQFLNFER